MDYHEPVLLSHSVDGLAINPSGIYVDVTFGGGGHSRAILERLNSAGRLYAFDQELVWTDIGWDGYPESQG